MYDESQRMTTTATLAVEGHQYCKRDRAIWIQVKWINWNSYITDSVASYAESERAALFLNCRLAISTINESQNEKQNTKHEPYIFNAKTLWLLDSLEPLAIENARQMMSPHMRSSPTNNGDNDDDEHRTKMKYITNTSYNITKCAHPIFSAKSRLLFISVTLVSFFSHSLYCRAERCIVCLNVQDCSWWETSVRETLIVWNALTSECDEQWAHCTPHYWQPTNQPPTTDHCSFRWNDNVFYY